MAIPRPPRAIPRVGLAGAMLLGLVACGGRKEPVGTELTGRERREIEAVFRDLGAGNEPGTRPKVAAAPGRWSDIPRAVGMAAAAVEAAVLDADAEAGLYRVRLRTISAQSGEFLVRREVVDGRYVADASFGLIEKDEARARRMEREFHRALLELAKIPRWPAENAAGDADPG